MRTWLAGLHNRLFFPFAMIPNDKSQLLEMLPKGEAPLSLPEKSLATTLQRFT
jgi:hypothetical protein